MFALRTSEEFKPCIRIDSLRESIQSNQIHFPVPVPIFPHQFRADIQWRLVELYFVRGWSTRRIAARYGVTGRRVQQSLQRWAARALAGGYLQAIPAGLWENEITLRSTRAARMYEPGNWIARVSPTPLLMVVGRDDRMTVAGSVTTANPQRMPFMPIMTPVNPGLAAHTA